MRTSTCRGRWRLKYSSRWGYSNVELFVIWLLVWTGCIAYAFWFEEPKPPRNLRNFLVSILVGLLYSGRAIAAFIVFFVVLKAFFGIDFTD